MEKKENNFAFIDSQNLNLSIRNQGWILDYKKFRKYLADKYNVTKAFLFIGFIQGNSELYRHLQEDGYLLVFKPTLTYKDGLTKGNVDAELVLQVMIEIENFDQAVIVTGDGDFHCLIQHLIKIKKLKRLLLPNQKKYSALLKRFDSQFIAFVSSLKSKLSYNPSKKKRTP